MKDVYRGDLLVVDHTPLVEPILVARFQRSNGKKMIHVSESLLEYENIEWYIVWLFHPLNPWMQRFNWYLHESFDTGLEGEWRKRAVYYQEHCTL